MQFHSKADICSGGQTLVDRALFEPRMQNVFPTRSEDYTLPVQLFCAVEDALRLRG